MSVSFYKHVITVNRRTSLVVDAQRTRTRGASAVAGYSILGGIGMNLAGAFEFVSAGASRVGEEEDGEASRMM